MLASCRASRDKGTVSQLEGGTRIRREVHTFFPSLGFVLTHPPLGNKGNVLLSTQREERLRRSGIRMDVCVGGGGIASFKEKAWSTLLIFFPWTGSFTVRYLYV